MSTTTSITTREFLLSVINGDINPDVQNKAQSLLAGLDARNEKRKSADSKSKRESASRRESVLAALGETPILAESIAETTGLSVGQVRAALAALVREGLADKGEVKVDKTKRMAYTLHVSA